ncbi:unnamed protein product [Mytilus edulis]|uniref:DNA-directed DNA polymerase n=1 Tax=Mytilus edulis TaxID=6550 RepID=A0A8S3UV57_MYTED|nr:unnamed protein product [Mytilus edulis]
MDTSLPNPKKSSITSETKFEPSGYSYIVLCTNDDYSKPPVVYRGDNVIEHFFEDMATEEEYINDILGEPEPLIMNDEAEQEFQLTTNCEFSRHSSKKLTQEGPTHFRQFKKAFPSEDIAKLLLRKNEYCYDYVDCEERFQERQLPSKEAFHNRLTDEPISDQDYNHALEVWNTMNMNTLGDFHDLYVMTDVLLLADVFERFRDITMENYGLDPCHFFTAPGLAWQAALKMSGVSLELITDPIIYNLVELGTRGGIASINQKVC